MDNGKYIRGQQKFNQYMDGFEEEPTPGELVSEEDTEIVANSEVFQLLKGDFDIRNFHEKFEDHSEELLYALMQLQDNRHPLKKGGPEIAYRCEAFILKNRTQFNDSENTVFDIISGIISSYPDDKAYVIYMDEIKEMLKIPADDKNIYKKIKKGVDGLKTKPLEFEFVDNYGKKRSINTPWYSLLTYDRDMDDDRAYVAITPMPLYKALLISATITHGAYTNSAIAEQLETKLVKSFYYYLELKKNYRAYPGATPGDWVETIEDFRVALGLGPSYKYGNINARILSRAKEAFEKIKDIDISFEYEPYPPNKKRIDGIHFKVHQIIKGKGIGERKVAALTDKELNEFVFERQLLEDYGYIESEVADILTVYQKYNRDRKYLNKAIQIVDEREGIKNKAAYLKSLLEEMNNSVSKTANGFHNFKERKYDYDKLEEKMMSRNLQG